MSAAASASRLAALAARFGADPKILTDRVAALAAEGVPPHDAIRRVVSQLAGRAREAAKERRAAELAARRAASAAAIDEAQRRSNADREARRQARHDDRRGLLSRWAAAIGKVLDPSKPPALSREEMTDFRRWRASEGAK